MIKFLKTTTFLTLSLFFSTPASALPGSDFEFYNADSNPTSFHTTNYENGLNGNNAAAFQTFVNTDASGIDLSQINSRKLDSSKLEISFDKEVKVYFVNEGAQYRNNLNVTSTGTTNISGSIFDDVSCLENGCAYPWSGGEYTLNSEDVLSLGDYVSVGNIQSGSHLKFELKTRRFDDYSSFLQTIYTDNSLNSGAQGVIAYEYEGYLILAWEDAHDNDFNDVVFALDIGQDNLDCIPTDGEIVNLVCNTNLFPD